MKVEDAPEAQAKLQELVLRHLAAMAGELYEKGLDGICVTISAICQSCTYTNTVTTLAASPPTDMVIPHNQRVEAEVLRYVEGLPGVESVTRLGPRGRAS